MAGFPQFPQVQQPTDSIKEPIMETQTATPQPNRLTDQPTHWPLFYLLPLTHYVRRQRAANSPEYNPRPKAEVSDYRPTSKKQTYYQRCIQKLTATRDKAWLSLKRFGREVARTLMKWCLLPLAIAACFSMIDAAPAELPVDYYTIVDAVLIAR
jgi:hypothetical protein